ncbi:MAG: HAD-IA family hydrolase [Chloroflexi bacterium]|nr:HAD-IA family hydrolase [Chloroflexota bacterium]
MIKAVFLDCLGTIAHPEPDRHENIHQVAQGLGVELPLQRLMKSVYEAESQVPAGAPPRWHEGADETPFIHWWEVLLAEAGVKLSREVMLEITRRVSLRVRSIPWVLYEDVLPTVKILKQRGLTLGLITNFFMGGIGLESHLDFVVTAKEVGVDKPAPPIFLAALKRAGVSAQEALYIGDQYQTDVVGARGVGITPILVDRFDLAPEVSDCPRIHSLTELVQYL